MRTTIRIDDQLLTEVKELAARNGRTITALIEESLRETLARRKKNRQQPRIKLKTFGRGGLRPGIDLSNMAGLLDLMESLDDSS